MKPLTILTINTFLLFNSLTIASPVVPTDGGTSVKKVFAAVVFPAAVPTKIWLCLEKFDPSAKVVVELLDAENQLMFREVLPARSAGKRNTYRQQIDLSQLTDGRYTVRLSSGDQIEKKVVSLTTSPPAAQTPERLISMN